MSPETAIAVSHKAAELEKALRRVIRGKDDVVRLALVSIFARGHLLIEGVPGVGKTTLGQALARAIDCTFQRVQFTSDMLPSDVVGISDLFRARTGIRIQARPRFHQRSAGRRDQPHHAQDAIRTARGHERRPGHRRRPLLRVAATVSGDCDAESGRASRNLSSARVAARSLSDARAHGISRRPSRAPDPALRSRRSRTSTIFAPCLPAPTCSRCSRQ